MAEIAVSSVTDMLSSQFIPLLVEEVNLLKGVRKEVTDIKDELQSIQQFLRDADSKAELNDAAKDWVKQLREVAHQIEDVIDEYLLHKATFSQPSGFITFLQKAVCCSKKLKWDHETATEILNIKTRILQIKARRESYSFNFLEQGSSSAVDNWHDPRQGSLFVEEAELVGIEGPKRQLITWLVEGELKPTVISLVGMGGLGKTTLARKVFDSQHVEGHFDCNAWISVSQTCNTEEILRNVLKKFCQSRREAIVEGINSMQGEELIHELREYLLHKRYLVVFDDVWVIHFWESMKYALLRNEKGSRIIITTRRHDVAPSCIESPTHVLELQHLPLDQAQLLFCDKVFQSSQCPKELVELSLDILKKCQGLPLAIVVIGGLLAKKKFAFQWKKFHDSLWHELESNPHLTSVSRILSLGYHDLPYYLKSCFLYFAIFPEDYSIRQGHLIRLWIAEGFVKEIEGKTLEDVAGEYLDELIRRSLIQVLKVGVDGRDTETS